MLKKMKIPAIVLAALLLLYTLLGFLAVPALVRSQAVDYLQEQYGLALAIDELKFNPYTLHARAGGVALDDASGARLVSWDGLSVDVGWRSLWERALVFQSITLSGPFVHVELQPDGDLNLAEAFTAKEPAAGEDGDSGESEGGGIAVVIDEFVLDRGTLRFSDLRDGRGFDRRFAPLALRLRDFSTRPAEPSELVALRIALGERGALTVAGELTMSPLAFDLDLDAQEIPLDVAQPYVPETLAARIANGALSFALHAEYGARTPEIAVRGDAAIAELAIEVTERDEPVLSWRELALHGIEFDLAPDRLAIAEIGIDGFDSVFRIHEDGTTNVGLLLGGGTADEANETEAEDGETETGAQPAPAEEAASADDADDAGPAFPFSVGRIVIDDSVLLFNDQQIRPAVAMQIEDLTGEITGVSSAADARVEAKLAGRVGEHGKADIGGHVAPFADANDLLADVSFGNIEMTGFSPYAGKFAGYEIAKGKLFLDLHYTLAGSRMQGENHALFDQFELGERVDSEDATSLPVKFALSLLRDRHGRIDITLPVEGDIDAPGFRFGHLIGQVLMNTLTKIVTAPFSFIAGIFGGGPDMEYAEFTPGSAEITVEERDKILPLVRALDERPLLILEIQGWAERGQDGEALRRIRLAETLSALTAAGTPVEEVLRTAFETQFGADASAALQAELEAALASPEESAGVDGERTPPADTAAELDARLQTEMQARLLAAQTISDEDLTALAFARGSAVMRTLVEGGAPAERVFVRNGQVGGAEDGLRAKLILGAR